MPETLELQEVDLLPNFESAYTLEAAEVLDEKNRVVAVTLISVGPGNKRDKNFYSQEAITSGAPLFNGAKCFANHPSLIEAKTQPERTVEKLIGYFTEVRPVGEELKAKLKVLGTSDCDWAWGRIKEAIAYAKLFPGKKFLGLSINARGTQEPMDFEGEPWKKVVQFLEVRSVDLVTEPARGGKFETILSESEGGIASSAVSIFNAMKQRAREFDREGFAGMADFVRQFDELGTALGFNKTEEAVMADELKKHEEPDGDEMDFSKMSEEFKKMADAHKEQGYKEMLMTASKHFGKQAEAKREAAAEDKEKKAEEAKREAEMKDKEEAAKSEAEKKEAEIQELRANLIETKTAIFISEAGLSEAQAAFVSNLLEGEVDLKKIEKTIKDYAKVSLKESAQRKPHNFEKREVTRGTSTKSVADRLTEAVS